MHGFYHADPHPGNLFALADGRVAFTDFGRCGYLSETARNQVADLLVAIIEQDSATAVDVLLEVSGGGADVDIAGLQRDVATLIAKYYDLELHEVDSKELVVEVMSLIGKRGLTMSSEFALLLTTLATLQALGSAVDPELPLRRLGQALCRAAGQGADATRRRCPRVRIHDAALDAGAARGCQRTSRAPCGASATETCG